MAAGKFDATKATVPFVVFKQLVIEASGLTVEQVHQFRERVGIAFDMGEPAWMVGSELNLRAEYVRAATATASSALTMSIVVTGSSIADRHRLTLNRDGEWTWLRR